MPGKTKILPVHFQYTAFGYSLSTLLNMMWKVLALSFQSYIQSHYCSLPNLSSVSLAWFSHFNLIYKNLYIDQRMEATNGSKSYQCCGLYYCVEFSENIPDLEIQEILKLNNCEQRFINLFHLPTLMHNSFIH